MPIPDRPVAGAEIETEWGQEIHDRTFAPKGCKLTGTGVSVADNTIVQIDIDGAAEDPGGWLIDPYAEVPTDGEGVYLLSARFKTDNVDTSVSVRCYVKVNGTEVARMDSPGDGAIQINIPINAIIELSAGDQITTFVKKGGTAGGNITVELVHLTLLRHGSEFGA